MSAEEPFTELEEEALMYPPPPSDQAPAGHETRVIRWRDATPVPDEPNLHLQPCYEAGSECNGDAICTETKWGLYCMHLDERR